MTAIEWTKACTCEASATCGVYRVGRSTFDPKRGYVFPLVLHPGPSCDLCGLPWYRARTEPLTFAREIL